MQIKKTPPSKKGRDVCSRGTTLIMITSNLVIITSVPLTLGHGNLLIATPE